AQHDFLKRMAARRERVVVLDVPLLFEVGSDALCDATIVVTAPRFLQEQRVLRRPGMTRERMEGALARQMPDHEKRRRADFVVQTGRGKRDTLNQLAEIVTLVQDWQPSKWPPRARARGENARSRP